MRLPRSRSRVYCAGLARLLVSAEACVGVTVKTQNTFEIWIAAILQPCAPKLEHFRAFDMERWRRQAPVIFFVVVGSELNDLLGHLRRMFTDSPEKNSSRRQTVKTKRNHSNHSGAPQAGPPSSPAAPGDNKPAEPPAPTTARSQRRSTDRLRSNRTGGFSAVVSTQTR